jgi:membrane protein DedA with SNARE-associated domain
MSFEHWGYLGILLVLLACSLGLPLPEDVPLLTGGLLCYKGLASVWLMIPIGLIGVLSGDFFLFWLGKRFGHHIVEHRLFRKLVNPSRLLTAEKLFAHHGYKIIFVGRFLPGLRPMLWVACGVLRVPFWIFAAVNGAAACISVPTLILLGKFFGHSISQIQRDVRQATHALLLIIGLLTLAAVGYYFHKRQKGLIDAEGPEPKVDAETLAHMPPAADPADVGGAARQPAP